LRAALHDGANKLTAVSLILSGYEQGMDPIDFSVATCIINKVRSELHELLALLKNGNPRQITEDTLERLITRSQRILPYLENVNADDASELQEIIRASMDEFDSVMRSGIRYLQMVPDSDPPASHDVSDFVLDIVNRFKKERPDIVFEINIEPQCISMFRRAGIRRSLENLILNATQAIPAYGGRISVSLKKSHYDLSTRPFEDISAGTYVTIEIEDNGDGIPSGVIRRLRHSMITTKKSGSGIGLASASEQLRRDNGHLILEGGDDRGARAIALLPSIPPAPDSSPDRKSS